MLLRTLVALTERIPSFRRWTWQRWYQHIAGYSQADWSFMNYGYQPGDDVDVLALDEADELDRLCVQLYHRTASAIDLTGCNVLEVGSGRGGGASFVKRYLSPATMTGADFSKKAVELCRQRHTVDGLEFCFGDAESLPFEDGSFDAVVNVESSHCYGSAAKFFSEVHRVLRPGGDFLFADFRAATDLDLLNSQLAASGLDTIEVEDITDNVVKAMRSDSARKQSLIRKHISKWISGTFSQFAGLEGSQVYESFRERELVYLRYRLGKPARPEVR